VLLVFEKPILCKRRPVFFSFPENYIKHADKRQYGNQRTNGRHNNKPERISVDKMLFIGDIFFVVVCVEM